MYVSSRSQNNPSQCFISEPNAMIYFSYSIPTMLLFFFFFICSCQCHHTSQSSTSTKTWQETYMNLCQMCILITLSLIWILSYILRHWVWFCNDFTDINKLVFSCLLILSWTYISNAVICETESLGKKLFFLLVFIFDCSAGHCQFCHNAVSALHCFFHVFLGYKNPLFWSDNSSWWCKGLSANFVPSLTLFLFSTVNCVYLFVNSITQLAVGLLFGISNFQRTTDSILVVILLKGKAHCFFK